MVIVLLRPGRAAAVLILGTAGDFKDSAPIALYGYLYFSILNGDGYERYVTRRIFFLVRRKWTLC